MDVPKPFGKQILAYFVLFFGAIIVVNTVFIYIALKSHTGVITKNPYEKGLKYDEILAKAKAQPKMNNRVMYKDGILRWTLKDNSNIPLENAKVTARVVRPVQDGYDTDITLDYVSDGQYEAALDLPMKGQWQVHLKAQWNNTQYQTTFNFQVK